MSSLDFSNGITLVRVPHSGADTRRAETDVELRDGQTFAIAGLLDNISQNDGAAIPVLSKLPIIGPLFKSKSKRAEQTELMVLITPRLVRAARSGRSAAAADDDRAVHQEAWRRGWRGRRRRRSSLEGDAGSSMRRQRPTNASRQAGK